MPQKRGERLHCAIFYLFRVSFFGACNQEYLVFVIYLKKVKILLQEMRKVLILLIWANSAFLS